MRDELAGQLIDTLMEWSDEEQSKWMAQLRRMATYKYDLYEGFSPGERFFESLARWLAQFERAEDRRLLVTFVREHLVFISRDELNHTIACVYPDVIKPKLIASVARELDLPPWRVRKIVTSNEFRTLRRKTLYLGLSDGARLDQLRRSSPELSHEQFWLAPELGRRAGAAMVKKLEEACVKLELLGEPRFRRVVLVDDFYGSGTSLLRNDGEWKGKLARAQKHIGELRSQRVLDERPDVLVILYIASAQAEDHIRRKLEEFETGWELRIVQQLPDTLPVDDRDLIRLCEWFFDPVLVDEHKGGSVPLGYKDAALPLVLHHNTPNNSISLLWGDTENEPESKRRHALFPRYERHHVDRP